jgi:hypothetical protein
MKVFTLYEHSLEERSEWNAQMLSFRGAHLCLLSRRMWMAEDRVGRAHGHAVDESVWLHADATESAEVIYRN